jgi:cbb3-type cytochrome oxidase subunit 1
MVYGHNAVAFFLTTPFFRLMYYFIPKAANRPVYSTPFNYSLLVANFYLHLGRPTLHLLYSALPNWAQNLVLLSQSC